MIGRTHVSCNVALLGAGLLLYTNYRNTALKENPDSSGFVLFNVELGQSVDIISGILLVMLIAAMVTLLFLPVTMKRQLRKRILIGSFIIEIVAFIGLYLMGRQDDPNYALVLGLFFTGLIIGSLLPDIDDDRLTLGRYVPWVSNFLKHRTLTHTIWIVILLFGLAIYFELFVVLGIAIGYVLHIWEDACSKSGICWFWPLFNKYKTLNHGGLYKTGKRLVPGYTVDGTFEMVVFIVSLVINVVCVIFLFYM